MTCIYLVWALVVRVNGANTDSGILSYFVSVSEAGNQFYIGKEWTQHPAGKPFQLLSQFLRLTQCVLQRKLHKRHNATETESDSSHII